jgi:hypothetical protein
MDRHRIDIPWSDTVRRAQASSRYAFSRVAILAATFVSTDCFAFSSFFSDVPAFKLFATKIS